MIGPGAWVPVPAASWDGETAIWARGIATGPLPLAALDALLAQLLAVRQRKAELPAPRPAVGDER
ncbi:hypothetical protein [Streptomyces aureocirculatus]|uniref:hypothetical protein n=1 Tax=Streptomyces aureocirculatus TaxID=67275 RepID=UPI0004CC018A|nr:hypothetical protein [Streptomyces aureocirculatus]